jgi:hypothetical protein
LVSRKLRSWSAERTEEVSRGLLSSSAFHTVSPAKEEMNELRYKLGRQALCTVTKSFLQPIWRGEICRKFSDSPRIQIMILLI